MTSQISLARRSNLCPRCGSKDAKVRHYGGSIDFKGLSLIVDDLSESVCNTCGHTWETDGQEHDNLAILKEEYAKQRDAKRKSDGLLTAEEIRAVLNELSLTKSEAASLFGGGPNAFNKYLSGEVLQSFSMDRLIRLTAAFGHTAVRFLSSINNGVKDPEFNAVQRVNAPTRSILVFLDETTSNKVLFGLHSNLTSMPLIGSTADTQQDFELLLNRDSSNYLKIGAAE